LSFGLSERLVQVKPDELLIACAAMITFVVGACLIFALTGLVVGFLHADCQRVEAQRNVIRRFPPALEEENSIQKKRIRLAVQHYHAFRRDNFPVMQ
jgi:hypothetical protein